MRNDNIKTYHIAKLPAHRPFNLCQGGNDLLIILPSADKLQADGSVRVLFWTIHVIHELVLVVLGNVSRVLDILTGVDHGNREHGAGVVEEVPV